MGRIEKLKRQAINEANRRVLGEQLRTPPKATGQPIRKSKNQGQVSTETLKKYGEVIQHIKGLGESVYKILNDVSGMISKLTPPNDKKPNLEIKDEVNVYGEKISELFKLLGSATPIEKEQYGKYMSQVYEPAMREAFLTGRDLDRRLGLGVNGVFEDIAESVEEVFKRINKENVVRRQRNEPFTSPVDYIYRQKDATRVIENEIEVAERNLSGWWKEKSKSAGESPAPSSSVDASAAMWKNIQGDSKGGLAQLKGEIGGE